jgi:ABC-type transport system involved in multi-copper enzyme maturation permease subunit
MNLPIAARELRAAARKPRTYRMRAVNALIFGVMTLWFYWISTQGFALGSASARAFNLVSYAALIGSLLSAHTTSDALSSEKRDGTLGLLFLTDLKPIDIVSGKFVAFGLTSFYSLMAMFPMLAMLVLMGGISGESIFRTSVSLLNTLFLGLSLGLWVSARSFDQKRATNQAVFVGFLILWGIPALASIIRMKWRWIVVSDVVSLFSPTYQHNFANPFGVGLRRQHYWLSVAITHALAWWALFAACRRLPREWQDRPVVKPRNRIRIWWQDLQFGRPEVRKAFRTRLLNINAIHWISAREKLAPFWTWFFIGCVLAGWFALWAFIRFYLQEQAALWGIGVAAVILMTLGLRMRTAAIASEVIARDRLNSALELLLSTTLTEKDVAGGLWLTFRRIVLKPAIGVALIGFGVFIAAINATANVEDISTETLIFTGLTILFVLDVISAMWTSMWMACTSRTVKSAPGAALLRTMLLPGGLFLLCMTFVILLRLDTRVDSFTSVFVVWLGIGVLNNAYWIQNSRRKFYKNLRTSASERYQPDTERRSWWRFFRGRDAVATIPLV